MNRAYLVFLTQVLLAAQPLESLKRLIVRVEDGSGIIERSYESTEGGKPSDVTLVVTAGHVLRGSKGPFAVSTDDWERQCVLVKNECGVIVPEAGDPVRTCSAPDVAILACKQAAIPLHRDFEVLARGPSRKGDKVGLMGYLSPPNTADRFLQITGADGDIVNTAAEYDSMLITSRFGIIPLGISGGAVFDERGRLRGVQSAASLAGLALDRAGSWEKIQAWIDTTLANKNNRENLTDDEAYRLLRTKRRLKPRSDSVLAVDEGETELAVATQVVKIPGIDSVDFAPSLRISRPFPGLRGTLVSGDLMFSGPSSLPIAASVSRQFLMPSVMAQYPLGQDFGFLRRSTLFGGIYAGGGVGWLSVTQRFRSSAGEPQTFRSWVPALEAGWRLRLRRKRWGIQASYREVFVGSESNLPENRMRLFSLGIFGLLK